MIREDVLCLTKKKQVEAEIARIHFEHRFDAGATFGTLNAREAKATYEALVLKIPRIPGLSQEERLELVQEIETCIRSIHMVEKDKKENPTKRPTERKEGVPDEFLFRTKFGEVRYQIDQIHRWHTVDYGSIFGRLTARETKATYSRLLKILPQVP